MSELVQNDSDGNQQFIWTQERSQSCGPACVYMLERIKTQTCPVGGEQRIRQITALLPNGYTDAGGTASYTALASALNQINIPSKSFFRSNFGDFLINAKFPFITRIAWPNNGGHFVVCVDVTNTGNLICLDPWYGLIEPPMGTLPAYVTSGSRSSSPVNTAGGIFSGHIVAPN